MLRCDQMLNAADSGYLPSNLKLLEEESPSLVIFRLFKITGLPGERQKRSARELADLLRAQVKGGRDVVVHAPPTVPAWQMEELQPTIELLQHDTVRNEF